MRRVHLRSRELSMFGSSGVTINRHARVEQDVAGFAVDVSVYEPGALNGRHPTGLWQLFSVIKGEGWASGADGNRVRLRAGEAVVWEPGEEHESGTATGMTAVIIQSPVAPLPDMT